MTTHKHLKARVRARMAETGERYAAARAQIARHAQPATPKPSAVDAGWALRGGSDPDAAALTNLLANRAVTVEGRELTEPEVLVVAGGLGAGYILWEFQHDDSRVVVLGFTNSWNYLDRRLTAAGTRLGLTLDWSRTGGRAAAATALRRELGQGQPVVVWPDRFGLGYWHLPSWLGHGGGDGHGGHPVVAYAEQGGMVHLDDRTLAPLTVAGDVLDQARARVGSYQNAMLAVRDRDRALPVERLREALRAGLADHVGYLGGRSESFAVPAWRKWARLLVADQPAKAWRRVFADGAGLFGALLSVWEGIEPAGMIGGHQRDLFADGLDAAAAVLEDPRLSAEADGWREIAGLWHTLAETAVPYDVPECARARELTATIAAAVAEGDDGSDDRAAAARELWALRSRYASAPPLDTDRIESIWQRMSELLMAIYEAESTAVGRLARLVEE